jgi:streptomycin 6-kinase
MWLKVGRVHPEALHEADGLRAWNGNGAVRLIDEVRGDEVYALLLERCDPGVPLRNALPEEEQDVVIARLLRRLWIEPAAGHPFRMLSEMCDAWGELASWRALARSGERTVLLHTDLHAGNVLSSQREPWLVIDPKPYLGDPHYDVLQHMLNCPERLARDPNAFCDRMAALAGLDAKRVRQWMSARLIVDPAWPFGTGAGPTNLEIAKRLY